MTKWCAAIVAAELFTLSTVARSQPQIRPSVAAPGQDIASTVSNIAFPTRSDLLGRFGFGIVTALLRSSDVQDQVRGMDRATRLGGPEALTLLTSATDASHLASMDPRALLALVRDLAETRDRSKSRAALSAVVDATSLDGRLGTRQTDPFRQARDREALVSLAQRQAAMALADSGDPRDIQHLLELFHQGGAQQRLVVSALEMRPPGARAIIAAGPLTPSTMALAAEIGDEPARDALFASAHSPVASLRAAALATLANTQDARAIAVALSSRNDPHPDVRIAAAQALVALRAPLAESAVADLIGDDATALAGLSLARVRSGDGVTHAAAARLAASGDEEIRTAAVDALGAQTSSGAVQALSAFVSDPTLAANVAVALARSPSPSAASAIEALARRPSFRRLAARAYVIRRFAIGEHSNVLDRLLDTLAASGDPRDRAVGTLGRVALGQTPVGRALSDVDPRVRRSAAMGAVAHLDSDTLDHLADRFCHETDRATGVVLALGLLGRDRPFEVSNESLAARVDDGLADAPLAAFAMARRDGGASANVTERLLSYPEPFVRAQFARGLGQSRDPAAMSWLAFAYRFEGDDGVRRAVAAAIAQRIDRDPTGAGAETLRSAAALDPDPTTRAIASPADHVAVLDFPAQATDVTWIQLVPGADARIPRDETGTLIRSDGLALPIAFDDDGVALAFVPAGNVTLHLAPRLAPYSADGP
jgi:HEAT repeat protein